MTISEAPAATLSISDVAAETGLSTSTLRYYEHEGLMRGPIDRASSTHRRYTDDDVRWAVFLTKLRSTGMPIRDIRRYTDLARQGEHTTPDRLALLVEHRERVLAQLEETRQSLATIDFKIATYERFTTR